MPDPWTWTPWEYAGDNGLFDGRWDDQLGKFRTIYTAETLVGCFLEVLARLRPDVQLVRELDAIIDDNDSAPLYPTAEAGAVGYEWLESRVKLKREAEAYLANVEVSKLKGSYVDPSDARVTIGELGPAWLDRHRAKLAAANVPTPRRAS